MRGKQSCRTRSIEWEHIGSFCRRSCCASAWSELRRSGRSISRRPEALPTSASAVCLGAATPSREAPIFESAWAELVKLVAAGLVGIMVTMVHRRYQGEKAPNRSLIQAAVLLCISGALMMIIIGNSTARALGIAGGASIIRFRTPVDDPKDAILLFIVLALGMATGLGAFAVTGLATLFLCRIPGLSGPLWRRQAADPQPGPGGGGPAVSARPRPVGAAWRGGFL